MLLIMFEKAAIKNSNGNEKLIVTKFKMSYETQILNLQKC